MAGNEGRARLLAVAGVVSLGAVLGACSGEIRAERQGRQFGDEVCDVRSAGSVEEAEQQLDQARRDLQDLQRIVGRPIDEDVEDIEENLADLVEHAVDGNDALLDQDIAVIQRNVDAVARTLSGRAQAAYEGIQEGLGDCDY
jgi:hypothetical protein